MPKMIMHEERNRRVNMAYKEKSEKKISNLIKDMWMRARELEKVREWGKES